MSEDDDKPTVILNFNDIKAELHNSDEVLNEEEVQDLDFKNKDPFENTNISGLEDLSDDYVPNMSYFFSYKTDYFDKNEHFQNLDEYFSFLDEVAQLNKVLTSGQRCNIIFYYNSAPKVINQITGQIKTKFPNAKTLIIAKNLSAEKADQHRKTRFGADGYLSDPFDQDQFYGTLRYLDETE
jgi:hypothetical protein